MKKITVLLLLVTFTFAFASNLFAVSEAAVLFLLISPGARAAGMGEAFVAVADDGTAVFWNPAGLAFQEGREITFMHVNWLPQLVSDIYYEFLAYRHHVPSLGGTIGGNITYLSLGENIYMDEFGEKQGEFTSGDLAISLSYGTKLNENLGLGVSMRYIRSMLAPAWVRVGGEKGVGTGHSFAADVGILYRLPFLKGLTFGANLSNMGPKITYHDAAQADPIPTNLKIGFSYTVLDMEFNKLRISMDTNKLLVVRYNVDENGKKIDDMSQLSEEEQEKVESRSDPFYKAIFTAWSDGSISEQLRRLISSVGVEYVYNNMIFLRAGYYYDEEGKVKYPSFGAGLQYSAFRFDFAYVAASQGHPLSDTMRFSLTARF
jgi:hypothetical protein